MLSSLFHQKSLGLAPIAFLLFFNSSVGMSLILIHFIPYSGAQLHWLESRLSWLFQLFTIFVKADLERINMEIKRNFLILNSFWPSFCRHLLALCSVKSWILFLKLMFVTLANHHGHWEVTPQFYVWVIIISNIWQSQLLEFFYIIQSPPSCIPTSNSRIKVLI